MFFSYFYINLQVYENIADHFSDTRYKPWPKVSSFLSSLPAGSVILDVGCGNGKNMGLSHQCYEVYIYIAFNCSRVPFIHECVNCSVDYLYSLNFIIFPLSDTTGNYGILLLQICVSCLLYITIFYFFNLKIFQEFMCVCGTT